MDQARPWAEADVVAPADELSSLDSADDSSDDDDDGRPPEQQSFFQIFGCACSG
eukprot:SAG11_NODE_5069_length_1673_cov_1.497143_4_plen_54_part_00